jgi:putative transposase
MARRSKFTEAQLIGFIKEVEAGLTVADLTRREGFSPHTFYRWKAKYGGMEVSEAQEKKRLEDENRRLKQIVAEQSLDIQALRSVVGKDSMKWPEVGFAPEAWTWSTSRSISDLRTLRSVSAGQTAPSSRRGRSGPAPSQHFSGADKRVG